VVDTLVVSVQHLQIDFDFLTDRKVGSHHAFGDLAEDHDSFGFEFDRSEGVRFERFGSHIGRRGCIVVLGVGPHLASAGEGSRFELGAIAIRAGAGA
jgi:hypothetical protein